LLTPSEADKVAKLEKELNLLHCKTGSGICDRSLLSQSEKEEVAGLERERNPETRAIERDEEAIERWKRKDWPRVKKTPRGWAPT